MAAFDFPNSPSNGDTYSANGIDWIYNGNVWKKDATAGVKGQKGEVGQKGQKGEVGEKGQKGEIGDKGQKGEIGPTGGSGGAGDKGQKGEVGEKGQKGEIGGTGGTGDKGEKGQKGQDGNDATGTKGQKGEAGAAADKGQKGEIGNTGGTGGTGSKGEKGQKGEVGATGSTGAKGQKGEIGAQGVQGNTGSTGSKGQKGEAAAGTNGVVKQVLSSSTNGTQYYRYYQGPIDTGLSVTINCADANNKILIQYDVYCAATTGTSSFGGGRYVASRLLRNNSQIAAGTGGNNESGQTDTGNDQLDCHSFSFLDTPGAGNHTYKVQVRHYLSGNYANYLVVNRSRSGTYRARSTLTCSEIEI